MPKSNVWQEYESQVAEKRMKTRHLLDLAHYLLVPRTFEDISIRLALNTFSDLEVEVVYIGLLEPDGIIHEAGHYGYADSSCNGPISIAARHSTPIRNALKSESALILQNTAELFDEFEDGYKYPLPEHWKTLAVFPVGDFGIVAIFFKNELTEDPDLQLHLQTLGALIGLHASRNRSSEHVEVMQDHRLPSQSNSTMSERQIVILKMIERGLTNAEIAKEVGYSESLIRQETVQIFRKLKVTGRKEILNHSNGTSPNQQ